MAFYIPISEITVAILEQGKEAEMSPIGMNRVFDCYFCETVNKSAGSLKNTL